MVYRPPVRVVTRTYSLLSLVNEVDQDHERFKHREIEYPFSHRVFLADPYVRGAYNAHANAYPVGAQFGDDDPRITGNRPLYAGVPDGKGWA